MYNYSECISAEYVNDESIKAFNSFLQPPNENGCVIWSGAKGSYGYGRFRVNKKDIPAHRFSYLYYHGDIPEKSHICHACDNPSCVAKDHLFLGDAKINAQDAIKKGRRKGNDIAPPVSYVTENSIPITIENVHNYYNKNWTTASKALSLGVNTYQYWVKLGYIPFSTQLRIEAHTKGIFKASFNK